MRFVMVLAVVLLLVGCAQASSSVEKQHKRDGLERVEKRVPQNDQSPNIPAYHITKEQECTDTGIVGKCYSVVTEVTLELPSIGLMVGGMVAPPSDSVSSLLE